MTLSHTQSMALLQNINTQINGNSESLEILKNRGILKKFKKGGRIYIDECLGFLYLINGKIRFLL